MKIDVVNLGNGLTRLDLIPEGFEPSRIPTPVADDIMRDVVRREQNRTSATRCTCPTRPTTAPSWARPQTPTHPAVESGFDAHIDRPLRSNYGGIRQEADAAFKRDTEKYYRALSAVKACDWPCKEDLKGVPSAVSQHNPCPPTKYVGIPNPNYRNLNRPTPQPCRCGGDEKRMLREALELLEQIAIGL